MPLPSPHRRVRRKGAAVVEYAVLAALVGGVAIGSVITLGDGVQNTFESNNTALASQHALAQDGTGEGTPPGSGGGQGGGGTLPPAADTIPDAFVFPPSLGWPGQTTPSGTIAIAGIDSPTAFAVTGDASAVAFLNGGTAPLAFGTVTDGDTLMLEARAPLTEGASLPVSLTVGGVEGIWILSAHDITPDAFAFVPSSAAPGAAIGSDPVAITGITTPVPFSFSGDLAVIAFRNGDPTPLASGTVANGDTLVLEATAPAAEGATQQAVLSVGNTDAAWAVSAVDATPDAFAFSATSATAGSPIVSDTLTVTGVDTPVPFTITGGTGSATAYVNGAPVGATGTVAPGDAFAVHATAPATQGAANTWTVAIGNGSATWATAAFDTTPDAFAFSSTNATAGSPIVSDAITVTGIDTPVPFTITGGAGGATAYVNGAPVGATGTVAPGDTLAVHATAPTTQGTASVWTVAIGDTTATWSTAAFDTTPDAFNFMAQTGLQPNATATSNTITLSGTDGTATVTVAGQGSPQVSIDGGAFTNGPTTAAPGNTVAVRLTAPATTAATHTATVTIGGVAATFQATTVAAIVTTASNASSVNVGTAFGGDWAANVAKTFVIPAGVVVGPMTIPGGMGGTLTVQNAGQIQGTGGAANGGAGGDAITASSSFTLVNTGAVRGGGGGGARGGQGGAGSTTGATEGPFYNQSAPQTSVFCDRLQGGGCSWAWSGTQVGTSDESVSTLVAGGRTYTRGAIRQIVTVPGTSNIRWIFYEVSRSGAVTSTTGGTGGAGGAGQGYGQTAAAGAAGSPGGTNAGAGGTGGTGGGWGGAGANGATGAAGNAGAGTAGNTGGAAGRAVRMLSGTLTVSTVGTINGAY